MSRQYARRCRCGRMENLHPISGAGRGPFPAAGCPAFRPASAGGGR